MLEAMHYKASSMFFVAKSGWCHKNTLVLPCPQLFLAKYRGKGDGRRSIPSLRLADDMAILQAYLTHLSLYMVIYEVSSLMLRNCVG